MRCRYDDRRPDMERVQATYLAKQMKSMLRPAIEEEEKERKYNRGGTSEIIHVRRNASPIVRHCVVIEIWSSTLEDSDIRSQFGRAKST